MPDIFLHQDFKIRDHAFFNLAHICFRGNLIPSIQPNNVYGKAQAAL
jgi:hypothetical protein